MELLLQNNYLSLEFNSSICEILDFENFNFSILRKLDSIHILYEIFLFFNHFPKEKYVRNYVCNVNTNQPTCRNLEKDDFLKVT